MPACARCGNENPEGFSFCGSCGAPLAATVPARETRKVVTVLFCDVAGSTALGERLDPEALRRMMARYFEVARSVVEAHGGTVEKFIGDAVMAVFGVPVLHEDDALRAVRAAAELHERLADMGVELERELGVSLGVRTGVNTGEVVTGTAERLATGDAVVVAQRLEAAAAPGEILLGEPTFRLVRDAIEAEATGPLELKGKDQPVRAYRLVAVRPGAPGVERRLDAPLVGRERELRRLHDAFESAAARRGCELFTVLGAAGVGKSRLVAELVSAVDGRARVLSGRCLPYGEGITYWALAEVLREAAQIEEADTEATARAKLAELVDGEDAERVATDVLPALGLGAGAPGELPWGTRRLLESLAREQPLVVVLDDVHWAEQTFLDLVAYVADWTRDAPLLLVCVARPELIDDQPGWSGGKLNATTILLEPLTEDETGALLSNLLDGGRPAGELRRRVVDAAEGNPLFVEELLGMLVEDGVVVREDGTWRVRGDLAAVQVPPTITALLAARLDRLDVAEREVLERASVEGKVFHRAAVVELSPEADREHVPAHLMALLRKELLRPDRSAFAGDEAFRFRHLLIRDAVYEAVPKSKRAELHEAFARWLDGRVADRLGEYDEIVAYHLEQAYRHRVAVAPLDDAAQTLAAEAAGRLLRAGERAAKRSDPAAASSLLRRGLELLPRDDRRRPAALLDLGHALNSRGEFAAAEAALDEADVAAGVLRDEAVAIRSKVERASGLLYTDPDRAMGWIPALHERATPVLEAAGDERGLAEAHRLRVLQLWMEARPEAAADVALRGADNAVRVGDPRTEGELRAWAVLALIYDGTPVPVAIERAKEVARNAVTGQLEAQALHVRAVLEAMRGDFAAARRLHAAAAERFRELGHVVTAVTMEGQTRVLVELLAGDAEAAERHARASYDELGRLGEVGYRSSTAAYLCHALVRLRRYDEALELAREAEGNAPASDRDAQMGWRRARAGALAGLERWEEAQGYAREAVAHADASEMLLVQGETRSELARIALGLGNRGEARRLLEEAIGRFARKGVTVEEERMRALLAGVA